jgi:hypothetical protein
VSQPYDDGTVAVTTGAHSAPDANPWGEPTPAPIAPPVPAAAGSPLVALRDRRKQVTDKLFIDLQVPRWGSDGGPLIYVRYKPAQTGEFAEKAKKMEAAPKRPPDWIVTLNADLLVKSCVGVFAIEGEPLDPDPEIAAKDPRPRMSLRDGDPHGSWTRFDPDLAYALGLPENCGAIKVVRELYFTDADLGLAAGDVLKFSGINADEAGANFFAS